MSPSFVVSPDRLAAPLKMVGEKVTVLASAEQTGSYEIFRQTGPEGAGPPPHSHPWDEAFYVIAGELILEVDGDRIVAPARSFVIVPRGTNRRHQLGPASRCLAVFSPGVPGH